MQDQSRAEKPTLEKGREGEIQKSKREGRETTPEEVRARIELNLAEVGEDLEVARTALEELEQQPDADPEEIEGIENSIKAMEEELEALKLSLNASETPDKVEGSVEKKFGAEQIKDKRARIMKKYEDRRKKDLQNAKDSFSNWNGGNKKEYEQDVAEINRTYENRADIDLLKFVEDRAMSSVATDSEGRKYSKFLASFDQSAADEFGAIAQRYQERNATNIKEYEKQSNALVSSADVAAENLRQLKFVVDRLNGVARDIELELQKKRS